MNLLKLAVREVARGIGLGLEIAVPREKPPSLDALIKQEDEAWDENGRRCNCLSHERVEELLDQTTVRFEELLAQFAPGPTIGNMTVTTPGDVDARADGSTPGVSPPPADFPLAGGGHPALTRDDFCAAAVALGWYANSGFSPLIKANYRGIAERFQDFANNWGYRAAMTQHQK